MDAVYIAIALGPLAVYVAVLGLINLWARPFLVNGARDAAALGIGISGLMIAGPMELLVSDAAVYRLGSLAWILLLALYLLCLTLVVLLMRPRLVIYNMTRDQMRPLLANLVSDLDREARWAGDSLILPKLGVQLYVETCAAMRIIQLVATGAPQSYDGWRQLESALSTALHGAATKRNPLGISLIGCGIFLAIIVTLCMVTDADTVAQSFRWLLP